MSETTTTTTKPSNVPTAAQNRAYASAVKAGKTAATRAGQASWILGDLASKVDASAYGARKLQTFADDIEVEYRTLIGHRNVCAKYAPSDRSEINDFTVHAVFASQEDRVQLLKAGPDGKGSKWSLSAARELVKARKSADNGDGDGDSDGNGESDAPAVDERTRLVNNVARLAAQLADAEAKLAEYDATHAPAAPAPKVHTGVRGVPQHAETELNAACPKCQATARKNGVSLLPTGDQPASTPRSARGRRSAA